MRTKKTIIGYKALTAEYTGLHGTDFSLHSVHDLPDTIPQAGKHGFTFALTMTHLFECFNTERLPIVVEVCAYGDTHIGRHLCATNHMVITRTLGYHEIQDILEQEQSEVPIEDDDRPETALTAVSEEVEEELNEEDDTEEEQKDSSKTIAESAPNKEPDKASRKEEEKKPFVHKVPIHFLAMVVRHPRSFAKAVRLKRTMRKK